MRILVTILGLPGVGCVNDTIFRETAFLREDQLPLDAASTAKRLRAKRFGLSSWHSDQFH
jgi:hypothetical protein